MGLPKCDPGGVLVHLDAKIEAEEAEITHVESLLHLCLERLQLSSGAGDDQIVDVDADKQDSAPTAPPIHRCFMGALLEAHFLECRIQLRVPCARSLLQAIESFAKLVDLLFFSGKGVARWLLHVHPFLEVVVEEG